jgi:transcriptional regulator with XRE-family HTH domain
MCFGERVATLRKAQFGSRSLSHLARKIGITPAALAKIEKGGFARLVTIEAIVKITGCSRDWLLAGEGEPAAAVRECAEEYGASGVAEGEAAPKGEASGLPPRAYFCEISDGALSRLGMQSTVLICVPERPRDGELALVQLKGEEKGLVRRVHFCGKNVHLTVVKAGRSKPQSCIVPAGRIRSIHKVWGVKF